MGAPDSEFNRRPLSATPPCAARWVVNPMAASTAYANVRVRKCMFVSRNQNRGANPAGSRGEPDKARPTKSALEKRLEIWRDGWSPQRRLRGGVGPGSPGVVDVDEAGTRRRSDRWNCCLRERPEGARQVADRAVAGIGLLWRRRADAVAARIVHDKQRECAVGVVVRVRVGQRERGERQQQGRSYRRCARAEPLQHQKPTVAAPIRWCQVTPESRSLMSCSVNTCLSPNVHAAPLATNVGLP